MPSPTGPAITIGAVTLLLGGVAVTTSTTNVTEDFEEQLRLLMNNTMRDLTVGWLDTLDAQGQARDDHIHELRLLVRSDGMVSDLNLTHLVILTENGEPANLTKVDGVRDRDGSLANGTLNADDLVRMTLVLPQPAPRGEPIRLTVVANDKAPLHIHLDVPRFLRDGYVSLDVQRSW